MEDFKLWTIEGTHATAVQDARQTDSEKLLEDILVENPSLLMDGLTLVGRQTPTQGGEALDLLGVDADGRLVVFELKRERLTRDAVTQVIDYTSYLTYLEENVLSDHIADRSGNKGIQQIESFDEWYSSSFPNNGLDSLFPARMFLVGLGADEKAKRMVDFLVSRGVDISLLTFYGFTLGEQTLLAKQVDVTGAGSDLIGRKESSGRLTRSQQIAEFNLRADEIGIGSLLNSARSMIQERLRRPFEHATIKRRLRTSFYVQGKNGTFPAYAFIELDSENAGIKVGFYPRSIDLAYDEFKTLDHHEIPFLSQRPVAQTTERVSEEIYFPVNSIDEWERHEERLTSLTQSVYDAWQKQNSAS